MINVDIHPVRGPQNAHIPRYLYCSSTSTTNVIQEPFNGDKNPTRYNFTYTHSLEDSPMRERCAQGEDKNTHTDQVARAL